MKKDRRFDNVEIEWVPWTPETWERHVDALAEVVEEIEAERMARGRAG